MQLHLYQYAQLLSLLLAILCFRGLHQYKLSLFLPMLLVVNLIEIVGTNYKMLGWVPWLSNHAIYNLNLLLETPMRLFLMGEMLQLRNNERPTFTGIAFLCMLVILLNYLFLQGSAVFNTFSLILIQIVTIVLSCFTLLRLAMREEVGLSLWKDPYFWINAGFLLFALITLVILGLQQFLQDHRVMLWGKSLYKSIMPVPNIILYLAYSYAFILCRIPKSR
jgi:magnesium-transporting ATPase (P-type)